MPTPRVDPMDGISRSKVERMGKLLRDLDQPGHGVPLEQQLDAIDVVQRFREAHAYPMLKVRVGLEGFVRTVRVNGKATQRHKRVPRIVRKLRRMRDAGGGTNLARLEDIGGCRVVLDTPAELEKLASHIQKRWASQMPREPRDYIASPKPMGYRAKHIIIVRDGRAIEVQLRTRGQQQWATAVEDADARLGRRLRDVGVKLNLKDEEGPESLKDYFRTSGEMIYRRENGLPLDVDFLEEFDRARQSVIADGYYTG